MAAKKKPTHQLDPVVYEKLKKIRASKTVTLKPTDMLRKETEDLEGIMVPVELRYYQVQGIYHLLAVARMVLGDGTGLGKTLQVIAALAYIWSRNHEVKAIVVAPKSALRQWADEIDKFATNITTYVVSGTLAERKMTYKAFHEHPLGPEHTKAVLIINYHLLVRDWGAEAKKTKLPSGKPGPLTPGLLDALTGGLKKPIVIYDECFNYHTPITLADGSTQLIGKIVCSEDPVSVLSWNWETGTTEPRQVVRRYRNRLRKGKQLVKVSFRFANSMVVTKDHQIYRMDGKTTKVSVLRPGHETAHYSETIPSSDQQQIILGGLLGDASVSHPKRAQWGIVFVQGVKQRSYLDFKRRVLEGLGVSEITTSPSGYGGSDIHRFRVNANPYLCSEVRTHKAGRKHPSISWLDRVTPLGLAVWYADDGSLQSYTAKNGTISYQITMNTQGFTEAEHEFLAGWLLWKWGVHARVSKAGRYHVLYLEKEAAAKFLSLLPGGFPGVMYKFPGKPQLNLEDLELDPTAGLVRDQVVSIEPWQRATKKREHQDYVYDLEVEANHNYFANGTLVSNCTAFKNTKTKTHQVCSFLSVRAGRCYGLTATLLKNNLIEGFAIYQCIVPGLFTTKTRFMDNYCVTKWQPVGGGRKIPIVVGYKNLDLFRMRIDPVFLGRSKHVVSDELPTLITREVVVVLTKAEDAKYIEAVNGILELGDGEIKDYEDHKAFVALIYCQQVVDSLTLLKYAAGDEIDVDIFHMEQEVVKELGSKEQAMMDLLTTEFEDEKVIVYTRFASLVPRLQELCKKAKIKNVAITGKVKDTEKNPDRRNAQKAFQDVKSDTRVIFITDAGSESINLQAAGAMIFFDAPWSWGNYVQLLGRPIRIGSLHQHVVAIHLVAERPRNSKKDRKTIDRYTLEMLQRKKKLVDQVLGESAVGALDFGTGMSFTKELVMNLQRGA